MRLQLLKHAATRIAETAAKSQDTDLARLSKQLRTAQDRVDSAHRKLAAANKRRASDAELKPLIADWEKKSRAANKIEDELESLRNITTAGSSQRTMETAAKLPKWIEDMSPSSKKAYLKAHPETKYAEQIKALLSPSKTKAPAGKEGNAPAFNSERHAKMAAKAAETKLVTLSQQANRVQEVRTKWADKIKALKAGGKTVPPATMKAYNDAKEKYADLSNKKWAQWDIINAANKFLKSTGTKTPKTTKTKEPANSRDPHIQKMAQLARNARKWKKK
jgi:hypothetical protein